MHPVYTRKYAPALTLTLTHIHTHTLRARTLLPPLRVLLQRSLLHDDSQSTVSEVVSGSARGGIDYVGILKSVWIMCGVETMVFIMTFAYALLYFLFLSLFRALHVTRSVKTSCTCVAPVAVNAACFPCAIYSASAAAPVQRVSRRNSEPEVEQHP